MLALGIPMFVAFGAAGTFILYESVLEPMQQVDEARRWSRASCEVIESRLLSKRGDESMLYRVYVKYRYEAGGRWYTNDRHELYSMYTSARAAQQAIVDRHVPGTRVECWVDPRDPSNAVLSRELPRMSLGMLLFSLPFMTVGYGGAGYLLLLLVRRALRTTGAIAAPVRLRPYLPELEPDFDGRLPAEQPTGQGIGALLGVNLFWNGMVATFVFFAFEDGFGSMLCIGLFLVPFIVIGLGMFWGLVRALMLLLVAQPVVRVDRAFSSPGDTLAMQLGFAQRLLSGVSVSVRLEGREEASYRRGTSTTTDTHVFYSQQLLRAAMPHAGVATPVDVAIPANAMHSFEGEHNALRWSLCVTVGAARWPSDERRFRLVVVPHGAEVGKA